ncbi:MAG: hypothetical protein RL020_782 [Pseudomonadota bacterium]|jgi:hypothetical protein
MFEVLLAKIKLKNLLVFTLLHFILGFAAFLWSFSVTSDVFEGLEVSTVARSASGPLIEILWFPVNVLGHWIRLPGLWGWLPIMVNSLLWGIAITILLSWLRKLDWIARSDQ